MESEPININAEAEKTKLAKTINDDVFALLSKPEHKIDIFIDNMNAYMGYMKEHGYTFAAIDDTYVDNINTIAELLKHENIYVSVLPIVRFNSKVYAINDDSIFTFDEIKSALDLNKNIIIYVAINNKLDKFRGIII